MNAHSCSEGGTSAWNEVASVVGQELAAAGVEAEPTMWPCGVELCHVPRTAVRWVRAVTLGRAIFEADDELLRTTTHDESIAPAIFVSAHGSGSGVEEIRAAGYARADTQAFFRYVWPVDSDIDFEQDLDDIRSEVARAAEHFNATVTTVGEVLPNTTCPDCGEPIFCGPAESDEHEHGFEEMDDGLEV